MRTGLMKTFSTNKIHKLKNSKWRQKKKKNMENYEIAGALHKFCSDLSPVCVLKTTSQKQNIQTKKIKWNVKWHADVRPDIYIFCRRSVGQFGKSNRSCLAIYNINSIINIKYTIEIRVRFYFIGIIICCAFERTRYNDLYILFGFNGL